MSFRAPVRRAARLAWAVLALLVVGAPAPVMAQLAGVPPDLPPGVERTFEILFGNDFLGRGGEIDDFRTQQLALIAQLGPRWSLVVDHSILTIEDSLVTEPGRIDHLSLSLGRRLLRDEGSSWTQDVEAGLGVRVSSEIAGARMQNGFHQLIGSTLTTMPYVDTDRVDGLVWLRAPRRGVFERTDGSPLLGRQWNLGYQVRASTLLTTDAEWDGSVGLSAVVSRRWFQGWLGVQADWRTGHDRDRVTRATAEFEEGAGLVLGFRFGPLLLETFQQFNLDAAYGHASFLSTGEALSDLLPEGHTLGLQAGLTVPDVYATVQARWASCALLGCAGTWRRSLLADVRFGSPQFGNDTSAYVDTWQVSAAYEMERAPFPGAPWLTGYGGLGLGYRSERLIGAAELEGTASETVGAPGLTADVGLRFGTTARSGTLDLLLQTGLTGWVPASSHTVEFDGRTERLQGARLGVVTGLVLRVSLGRR